MQNSLHILSQYGVVGFLLMMMIYAGFSLLKNKLKNASISLFQISKDSDNSELLKYNPFFQKIGYRLAVELPSLEFDSDKPVKQQMFRDILIWNAKYTKTMCEEIIKIDMDDWSGSRWSTEVINTISEMVLKYQTHALENGVPPAVINKFNKWQLPVLEMVCSYIKLLGESTMYTSNISRTNTMLMVIDLLLITTIADAERSLHSLNGEISGLQYKGMSIEG